jgi:hypothetical protein
MADEHRVIGVSVEAESHPLSDILIGFNIEGDDKATPPRPPKPFRMSLSVANQLADKIREAIHLPKEQGS